MTGSSCNVFCGKDAFGSSCFLFLLTHSHNRMPLAPHVFFSTHRTGCPWLLTEQDAFGSSCGFQLTGRSEAPHVVVLVQFPNVCFCSKNTEYGKQLSAPQACNCAKSVFFASFEMGSNASKPPAPASSRLSNEDTQELVGRLVSLLPAPTAPAAAAVPVPVFGTAPVPPATPGPEPPRPPPATPPPPAHSRRWHSRRWHSSKSSNAWR